VIEPAAGMRARQSAALPGVRFVASADELEPFEGAVIANEVLDALPFRLVEDGREVWVGLDGDRFRADLRETDLDVPGRGRVAVRPGLAAFVTGLVRPLTAGRVLIADYGADGPGDAVRTYIGGQPGGDPLQAPGTQDITADVDFAVVRSAVLQAGLKITFDGTQAAWLRSHGAAVPAPGERSDEEWRLATLLDESLNWRVLIAAR
jgi:SAM-dependent MidA family methyltransferase